MTKQATLKVETRDTRGKGPARRLRSAGQIPGNLYGHGVDPVAVQANERELEALVGSISVENTLVDLEVDGGAARKVLIREIQTHPVRPKILHVDFFEIRADEKLKVNVPLHLVGTPIGVKNGGVLQHIRYELEVECLPADIPGSFEVDISALTIGDSLHVRDVPAAGFEIQEEPDLTICTVSAPRVVEEEPEAEEGLGLLGEEEAEPEVITARHDDDEEDEED
jgi:large subunit ribosomal protein L25